MKSLESKLKASLDGEVYFDEVTRHVYSVDASIFEVLPLGIVIPRHQADLRKAIEIAASYQIPVTVRGAATGITGGCLGRGLILDLSKYLCEIIALEPSQGYVICEPGVVQDDLNRQLSPYGYRLGPDTSTGNRATLGGMLANNAAGARSLRYGKMSDHVQAVDLLLSNGQTLSLSTVTEEEWALKRKLAGAEGEIYRTLWEIREQDAEEIRQHFPQIPRRVSGYRLDELLNPLPFNISSLIAGSEGTLGIAAKIKMGIVPKPKALGLLLLFFDNLQESFRCVPELLEFHPLSLELIDHQIISLGRSAPLLRNKLGWLTGDPEAILVFELEGENPQEAKEKIERLRETLLRRKIGKELIPILSSEQMADIWDLRKAGLGILLSKRTYSRAIAFIEDLSISPARLAPFMEQFCAYLKTHGKEAGIYGHVGAGCMHIRPYMDLRDPKELILMRQMMEDISSLVLEYGGAMSGEHGDGLIRTWLNPKLFGKKIMEDFRKIKQAFDPLHLMNPGKIIPDDKEWEELRTTPNEKLQSPKTFLDFTPEGGFELAADLCNGNGLCRKQEGVMCPSFQATREEFHSTRARAEALRAIIHQRLPLEAFTSKGVYDVMDLCLSCKGCKTECPSQVDMAKFKSEFLYHYQEKHGYTLRSLLFGQIGRLNAWLSPISGWVNRMSSFRLVKKGLEWIGISPKRTLPSLASERFSSWFNRAVQPPGLQETVVLLNDTFTEFNHPEIGQAAVRLLNACGVKVVLPSWSCCGRPALSKGLLPSARQQAHALIERLWPYAQLGHPIIGLEPSCLLTLRDDYGSLIDGKEDKLKRIAALSLTLDEFLALQCEKEHFRHLFKTDNQKVKVHGHCYQKSLVGMEPTLKVLRSIPEFSVELIQAGCCGMAGSFGYEKEHEPLSMKIGELHLFPAVRESDAEELIIASGMSCRHQIVDGTGRQALHLAQALANRLSNH